MSSRSILRQKIYLIGDVDIQILGNKLPSKLQVMKVFFFHTRILKSPLRESAMNTINEVKVFWQKANLPTQRDDHCIDKVLKLYGDYQILQKHKSRAKNQEKEQHFVSSLNNLFDIANVNIFEMIGENEKMFLLNQRKDGRVGYIANIESEHDTMERENSQRDEMHQQRVKRSKQQTEALDDLNALMSSQEINPSSQNSISTYSNFSDEFIASPILEDQEEPGPSKPKRPRGTANILNYPLVAALDRCKISDRNAVYLITFVAEALNVDANSLVLNRSSIRRCRERIREAKAENIRQVFKNVDWKAGILHWDEKMLPNMLNRKMVERLPVIISSGDADKILGVPELDDGKGVSQATAIFEVIVDWGLSDSIKAICCDTTASNLGRLNGSAVILEQLLEKDLLFLPCRHHIYELILRAVFEQKFPSTTGPNVPLFKRFQDAWSNLDQNDYSTAIENEDLHQILHNHIDDIDIFVKNKLESIQPREDYKEFLLLVQIFIGKIPRGGIKFRKPGAFHHARWMSKAIYVLKMFLFRKQLKLKSTVEKSLSAICIFLVLIYIRAWFTCPLAPAAPNHDLQFIKKLHDYKSIDSNLSQVSLKKIKNHLWYLNAESAAMAFFDAELSDDVKRRMVVNLENIDDESDCPKRVEVNNVESLYRLNIDNFISSQSRRFFERFEINMDFLEIDPSQWPHNRSYNEGLNRVKSMRVVNDTAERAIKLIEEYNSILTENEDQKQFLVQILADHRKNVPDARKSTVLAQYKTS